MYKDGDYCETYHECLTGYEPDYPCNWGCKRWENQGGGNGEVAGEGGGSFTICVEEGYLDTCQGDPIIEEDSSCGCSEWEQIEEWVDDPDKCTTTCDKELVIKNGACLEYEQVWNPNINCHY